VVFLAAILTGMPRVARFRLTNINLDVTAQEIIEALGGQLALDDVVLDEKSLRKNGADGFNTLEAEFELPDDEADLVRGPMRDSKVFIRRTIVLHFEEIKDGRGSGGPSRSTGSSGSHRISFPPPKKDSPEPTPRCGVPDAPREDQLSESSSRKWASAKDLGLDDGDRGDKDALITSGRQEDTGTEKFADLSIEERAKKVRELTAGTWKHTQQADTDDGPSEGGAVEVRGRQSIGPDGRPSIGPEMAYCSRLWTVSSNENAAGTDGEVKQARSCTTVKDCCVM